MKYLVLNLEKMVVHSQSGIARNTAHIHERRTMSLSELMLITEGEMYIRHMEDYHLVKNDIFFLPQGIEHYGTKPTDCQLHWHHFFLPSNSYIVDEKDLKNEPTGKDTVVLPMHFNLKDPETVFLLSYQLEQYPWTTEETQKVRNALVTAVIGEIALEYRQQSPSIPHKRLNSIISYIDNNFQHHPVSIKVLAETFGYNEKYIHSLFKKYLNVSAFTVHHCAEAQRGEANGAQQFGHRRIDRHQPPLRQPSVFHAPIQKAVRNDAHGNEAPLQQLFGTASEYGKNGRMRFFI